MKSCLEAVRQYFDARTQNWLAKDERLFGEMMPAGERPQWLARTVHQAERKRRAYLAQGKRLARAHTKIDILEMQASKDKMTVRVTVLETICWAYIEAHTPAVECRRIVHRQVWVYSESAWRLQTAEETSDGQSFLQEDVGPRLAEDLRTPKRPMRNLVYDRVRATRYADVWWDGFNPRYPKLADDCTNFISQCIHAGGVPMTKIGDKQNGWWVGNGKSKGSWSYTWTTSNALYHYVLREVGGKRVPSPSDLKMGDLIFYDWEGTGTFHHSTIITDFDDAGYPLVNAHTDPSYHRPFTYYDSRAWTEQTRYAFVHLPDNLSG
ncbi:amidase domain-containing protein [Alicyclobacillus acidoterrestris]|uniref:Amidase domain-containing protein n=1 Tax=Alicyclobacillus acidoterrestris (strain ATCC 49025 / DSM 3922 / CIP 106132 / NCIMB 13137 / GD3B) TaxID=1356854 RepID=T0CZP7_ALIAG|nr:amidase domain-containing protein [Alicyclobacillus acidoterrestris]EPZ43011.1 hypothetical protein N007_01340 [Alicyclobacillus acidoterrestris ATCC 49025]UNO49806.1 amidase domain-containing protein [Alicyclobacillus acidoterrestris]